MSRVICLIFALTLIKSGYSQIEFESGYFLDNNQERVNCKIKNVEWKNNPTKFEYMLFTSEEVKVAEINDIKEFAIGSILKYVRFDTKIDQSKINLGDLSIARNPEYIESKVFLRVILEGNMSLLAYEQANLRQFFILSSDKILTPLVYKRYLKQDNTVSENTMFRQQLLNILSCQEIDRQMVELTSYTENSLAKLVKKYNDCVKSDQVIYKPESKKNKYHITLRPGFAVSSLSASNRVASYDNVNFSSKVMSRFGIEFEFIFPYNKNKWSLIIEPTYQQYRNTLSKSSVTAGYLTSKVKYKSIELPVGIRHNFFINEEKKIFIDLLLMKDFNLNSNFEFTRPNYYSYSLDLSSRFNLGFGVGYKVKSINLELRAQSNRDVLSNYSYWDSKYKSISFIFGYSLI